MNEKKFKMAPDQLKELVAPMGYCMATDRITVDGAKVGYMYREEPHNEEDSGWRFFSGDEDQDYCDDPDNLAFYDVNTIANYDPAIVPYLQSSINSSWARVDGSDQFEEEPFEPTEE
jgi:hypothetical protein